MLANLTLLKQQLRKTSVHHLHTAAVKDKTPVTESAHSTRLWKKTEVFYGLKNLVSTEAAFLMSAVFNWWSQRNKFGFGKKQAIPNSIFCLV